jgi:hypothetical protein
MKYVIAAVASPFMSSGLVLAASSMASCGNWSTPWLCRVAERVSGAVLAPGLTTELYGDSKFFVLMSDALFYAGVFFLILCLWIQRIVPRRRARSVKQR